MIGLTDLLHPPPAPHLVYKKKKLPGRGVTKVEKHWYIQYVRKDIQHVSEGIKKNIVS